jgi:predicted metalloprotease
VGIGTIVIAAAAAYFFGVDPRTVIQVAEQVQQQAPAGQTADPGAPRGPRPDDELADFSSRVLADTEDTWTALFRAAGREYIPPKLVLFDDSVSSACGTNSSAVGPFYCPGDQGLYIDLAFFDELAQRFGAPGDFAQAYVIAHEVGHHVQRLLGISDAVDARRRGMSREQANDLSVRQELQADCYAGAWANRSAIQLDPGDIEEGMRAAASIGDDRIQRESQGRVAPESWTHGSSEMRVRWLRRGMETGDPNSCDTFAANEL